MTTLYNLRHSTDNNFTITKFVDGEVESSYELAANLRECACPAGHRPSCRHRQMAPMMLAAGIIDTHYFWDYDLNRAVDFNGTLKSNFDAMEALAIDNHGYEVPEGDGNEEQDEAVAEGPPSEVTIAHSITLSDDATSEEVAQAFAGMQRQVKPWRRL